MIEKHTHLIPDNVCPKLVPFKTRRDGYLKKRLVSLSSLLTKGFYNETILIELDMNECQNNGLFNKYPMLA